MKNLLRYQTLQALLRLTLLVPMAFSFSAMAQELERLRDSQR
jgi:hypothetical protein